LSATLPSSSEPDPSSTLVIPSPSHSLNLKISKPSNFDGDKTKFNSWIHEISLYLSQDESVSDNTTIAIIMSYIKTGHAAKWADNYMRFDTNKTQKFEDFIAKLNKVFGDQQQDITA
jgi:hypothetical protein